MSKKPDGGPAFPCSFHNGSQKGMSLRDWLAGNAPKEIADYFVVQYFGWPDDLPSRSRNWLPSEDDTVLVRWRALTHSERARCTAAWPWAWANDMLAEREK